MTHHPPQGPPRPRRASRGRRQALGLLATAALFGGALAMPATAGAAPRADDPPEQIVNGDFSSGSTAPWWWTANSPGAVRDGRLCADVPGGTINPWDAIIGQDDLPLIAGESYTLSFTATSTVPVTVRTNVQMATDPFTTEMSSPDPISDSTEPITHVFTAKKDNAAAQLVFQVGGSTQPFTFCIDDVSLRGGAEPPVYVPDTGPPVRVNQVGYLTKGPKDGTFVTAATAPLTWRLNNASGTQVATGSTKPQGVDPTSNQNVHTFDFSSVTQAGDGYTITIDGQTSEPFSIGGDLYQKLRTDALAYYYHNRSGIAIDDDIVGAQYARPAGHTNVAPNQGDNDVPCQPGVCDYTLDAAGGWYDAGDQGKYVVNGGISVAQLMSSFERTVTTSGAAGAPLGDGKLRLPEHGNAVPDILDEARWEMDFLMRMQVPAGEPLAGMVHHKLHDRQWTGLPLRPDQDPQPRELHPPSTAATLNVAATGAQCARLFKPYDADFAARCLSVARTAYAAAKAHPTMFADPNDGVGGGTYSDDNVTDEFFWAASELFVTTGEDAFRQDVLDSELYGDTDAIFPRGGMSWGATAGLGALDLATVPNKLTADQLSTVRGNVTQAADGFAADSGKALYGVPYAPDRGAYVWGSNSQVLNNMVVLATAEDLTGKTGYRDAVLHGLDYILGRNPLNQSYVTGWGERNSHNQHHRFWAHELNASLPNPAPGALAGGPNSGLEDPIAQEKLVGCAPAMCYIDDIESFSTNEVTVNWNAPLAWIASYVDDLGDGGTTTPPPPPTSSCKVSYVSNRWPGGFSTNVSLKNTGTSAIDPWELRWTFPDDQRITQVWNSQITQIGRDVVAQAVSFNRRIAPGGQVDFGFNGTSNGPAANPTVFMLNGGTCATS